MLEFCGLLVRQVCCCFGESLRKWNVAPIAGMIDCCPARVITVLNISPMLKENFGYGSEVLQTCSDKWSPILGGFRPINDGFVAQ